MSFSILLASRREVLKSLLLVSMPAGLVACGGGGGGGNPNSGNNLAVGYSYAGVTTEGRIGFAQSVSLPAPQLTGLNGNVPHFSIVSGLLPAGLVLNPSTGVISGRPTEVMSTTATIRLTVDGFSGFLDDTVSLSVLSFAINYAISSVIGEVGVPIQSIRPSSTFDSSLGLTYQVSPNRSFPPGLALNPQTGEITGTPTTAGGFDFGITGTVLVAGQNYQSEAVIICNISEIQNSAFGYSLSQFGGADVINIVPWKNGLDTDTYTDFHWVGGAPAGLVLDPVTGVITGSAPIGRTDATIAATFYRGTYAQLLQATMTLFIITV